MVARFFRISDYRETGVLGLCKEHASLHVRAARKRRCMAEVATLLSRDVSGIFRRQRGGNGRRLLDHPVGVEVKWKASGSACVLHLP